MYDSHLCFESNFFINKVRIMTLMVRGFEQRALRMSQASSIAIVPFCLCLVISESNVRWGFSWEKRERSLQVVKTESIPLRLITAECNFDSHYWEQTAQTESFPLIIQFITMFLQKEADNNVHMQQLQRSKIRKFICSFFI